MRRWTRWTALGAVLLGVAARSAAAGPDSPQAGARSGAAGDGGVVTVGIEQLKFRPDTLRVARGTTVRWVNRDPVPHTVVSGTVRSSRRATEKRPSGLFESATLEEGDAFEFTLREKREISYYCGIHPFMTGVIVVE